MIITFSGLSFDRFKLLMQSQSAVSSRETGVGVGSAVEFKYSEVHCRGVVEWIGCMPHLPAKMKMAGIRLVSMLTPIPDTHTDLHV